MELVTLLQPPPTPPAANAPATRASVSGDVLAIAGASVSIVGVLGTAITAVGWPYVEPSLLQPEQLA